MSIQQISDASLAAASLQYQTTANQRDLSTTAVGSSSASQGVTETQSSATDSKQQEQDAAQAAQAMQEFVAPFNDALKFSIDKDTGGVVVKVIDSTSDKVIKQIPSEEAIALAKALDKIKGLLVQQKA